jgi:serine/threonine-protein kinase
MEYLDGADLEEIVRVGGPMPPARALKVLSEVAGALEEAHGIGLIHRDIKPSNVILCTRGGKPDVAKLVDFGLVKELQGCDDAAITQPDAVIGTPLYLAPEIVSAPDRASERSDLYALGAVGYFLLTGQHVFEGRTLVEILGHHMHTQPQSPSERRGEPLPADVEDLLLACLAKSPEKRPSSARELLERIAACEHFDKWSETEARTWWSKHARDLRQVDYADSGRAAGTRTVAIALERRAQPPTDPAEKPAEADRVAADSELIRKRVAEVRLY